jgi:DNA invertase Pin-like site-specific DNA recombinase
VKAAIYLRVSTQDQSLDNQLPDLERLAAARQLKVVETFSEKVSAAKARPQFNRLLADAHRGRFQVVIVWSLDRLHRSMLGALQTVLDLDRMGVQVVSLREPWLDTGGPVRPLLIAIFGWVAEQERIRIGERTRAGLDRARRRGVKLGRPRVELDLGRLADLRADGLSMAKVAAQLGVSVGTIHAALRGVQQTSRIGPSESSVICLAG